MKELLSDTSFKKGFDLLTNDTTNGRALSGVLNYNGEAEGESPDWLMAQWWTPDAYNFINSTFTKTGEGQYDYINESRHLVVDTNKKSITLAQNSYVEYMTKLGHSRTGNENWSHFLIEQNFKEPSKLTGLKHLWAHLEFTLNKSVDMDPGQAVPCAQITWYFTITDVRNGDSAYESGSNDFFWFGLPLYDSRYDFTSDYHHVDSGFVGATNKLIYTIGSKNVLPEPIKIGKKYVIDIDMLPFIKEAFIYGYNNGAMANSDWKDLVINYMNLGWELPGSFDVSITLENLSVVAETKESK